MSIYFNYFLLITVVSVLLSFVNHRFTIGTLWIFVFFWVIPVLISQISTLPLNEEWKFITTISATLVILGFFIGYFVGKILPSKSINFFYIKSSSRILHQFLYLTQVLIIIIFILMYYKVGQFPLFSDNILENRKLIQSNNKLLWSMSQFSFVTASISSIFYLRNTWTKLQKILFVSILFMIVMSGWRNYLLMYLGYFYIPILFRSKFNIIRFIYFFIIILIAIMFIGYIRGDLGDIFTFIDALSLIGLYIYPNFINFQTIVSLDNAVNSLYTIQFLFKPILEILGYSTIPNQVALNAFNVSTFMNPLYTDGGLLNIFIVAFIMGFTLNKFEKFDNYNNIIMLFIRSTLLLTVVFFHNGWLLLNFMPTYNIILFIILILIFKLLAHK